MDENRLKEICKKVLRSSYKNVDITEFKAVQTNKFNYDSNNWEPDSYAIFLVLKKNKSNYNDHESSYLENFLNPREVEEYLENLVGFECCIEIR